MIKELIEQKDKYFWSKSETGNIIVGGYNDNLFYGRMEFIIDKNSATIKIDVYNGVSSSMRLSDRQYSKMTPEYQQIMELFNSIDEYLNDPYTQINQEVHRGSLLRNVMNLLPKYDGSR